MTNTPQPPHQTDGGKHKLSNFYRLTPEIAAQLRRIQMPAAAWRLWSYLCTFEPFGNYAELPELKDILKECCISKATFYRAIAIFTEHDLFDFQPTRMFILNLSGQRTKMRQPSQNCDSESQNCDSESQKREFQSQNCDNSRSAKSQNADLEPVNKTSQCTNNRSKDLKNNRTVPTHHPVVVPNQMNRENIGTETPSPSTSRIEELCTQIEQRGLRPNQTIRETIAELLSQKPDDADRILRNALSSLQEQQEAGTVRNPGGFLVTALRRKFTSNDAKIKARVRQEAPRPEPPDLTQISLAIDIALQQQDDRDFALGKLQRLWEDGWHEQIEELLVIRRDWGFSLTQGGVSNADN